MLLVFYEDQRGERGDFGFHRFVCQLVIDRADIDKDVYDIEKSLIRCNPMNGAGNVKKKLEKDIGLLLSKYRKVIAVYDQDKLADLLKLKGVQCRMTLRNGLMLTCEPKNAFEVVLIKDNIETVIKTIRNSGIVNSIDAKIFEGALAKNHPTRDSVFNQCAVKTDVETRKKLLEKLPDVDRLVTKIVESIQPMLTKD